MTGALTFAAVIGLMADSISSNVESVRTSNDRVLESHDMALVNWGEYTRPMLRQLDAARREGRLNGPVTLTLTLLVTTTLPMTLAPIPAPTPDPDPDPNSNSILTPGGPDCGQGQGGYGRRSE